MTIASYTDLQTAIANWIARGDLTATIPDFIMLFETVANRRLRTRFQEATVTLTPSGGVATLPADFLAWRRVTWQSASPRELEYAHPAYLHSLYPTLPQGFPRYFTIEGSNLTLGPSDNTALTLDYFQKIPQLGPLALQGFTTNWLLTAYPDLYLWGSLAEAQGFVKDYDALSAWASRREDVFNEIERLDKLTRGPSAIKVVGATP
jgi:hypothetical protein